MKLYASLIDRLRTQHEAISILISTIDNRRLQMKPLPGKWSIKDNIAHLTRYQQVFTDRIHQILDTDSPFFERYKAEDDSGFENCRNRDTEALLENIASERQVIFNLITQLNDNEIQRIGIHGKYGQLTVLQWTEFFLLHEAHHLFTIFQLANDMEL
jgi:hypothetical protein